MVKFASKQQQDRILRAAKVGVPHRVGKTESMEWFKEHFGLTLVEE